MPTVQMECQRCQASFQGRIRADKPDPKYCSRACRDEVRRTGVMLTCRQCGQEFYRKRYQENWSQERGPFCGMPCYGAWQRANIEGPSSPSWGVEPNPNGRGSHRWLRNRLAALERDGHRCVECGVSAPLHVHHVVPWEAGQEDPHALGNLVTLCAGHHRAAHRALGGW